MKTFATSHSADASISITASITPSPLSGSVARCHPPQGVGIAGGGSIVAAATTAAITHRRASSSSAGSGSKSRKSLVGSSTGSSKSTRTEGSHSDTGAPRIVYGPGTIDRLPTELGRLRVSSPLIVSSPSRISLARRIQSLIPNLHSRILDSAVVNVPARVVDDAVSRIDDRDVVISVGGASAVGLAKAIGIRKGIPHVCVPTTYSGSEMMPLLLDACPARHSSVSQNGNKPDKRQRRRGERDNYDRANRKAPRTTTFRDPKVLPSVVIYDEDLTMSASKRFSAPSDETATARSNELRKEDDTAQWSYLHLPGV